MGALRLNQTIDHVADHKPYHDLVMYRRALHVLSYHLVFCIAPLKKWQRITT